MSKYPKPFDHNLFADIPKYIPPMPPEEGPTIKTPVSDQAKIGAPKKPKIKAFCIISNEDPSKKSDFFNNKEKSAHEQEIESDNHFCFVPGVDEAVCIAWEVANPVMVKKVKWELFSAHDQENSIWSLEKSDHEARTALRASACEQLNKFSGSMQWEDVTIAKNTQIGDNTDAFPNECITLEHAPYQLKMTVYNQEEEAQPFVGWTYFDILVHSIELYWGLEEHIPSEDISGVEDPFKTDSKNAEKEILKQLRGGEEDGEIKINDSDGHEILLPCNQFAFGSAKEEFESDGLYERHAKQWGEGARIPIKAKVFLKMVDQAKADGDNFKKAAKALGQVKFMWDWSSKNIEITEVNYPNPKARTFLENALNYKVSKDDGSTPEQGPPGSQNCHKDHGGKRGGPSVFPPQDGSGNFPFKVEAVENRKWAAFSYACIDEEKAIAGYTGVLFQPSRTALDNYKVAIYLAVEQDESGKPVVDITKKAEELENQNAGLPKASTGQFQNFRQLNGRYLRKCNNYDEMDLTHADTEYARAGVKLKWAEGDTYFTEELYNELIAEAAKAEDVETDAVKKANKKRDYEAAINGISGYIDPDMNQYTGQLPHDKGGPENPDPVPYPVVFSWDYFYQPHHIKSIHEYIYNKNYWAEQTTLLGKRIFNDKAKKFKKLVQGEARREIEPAALPNYTADLDDEEDKKEVERLLLKFYNDTLTTAQQGKVDILTGMVITENNWQDPNDFDNFCRRIKSRVDRLVKYFCIRSNTDARNPDHGFTFFHCYATGAVKKGDTFEVIDEGSFAGVGPAECAMADGKKGVFLLFFPASFSAKWIANTKFLQNPPKVVTSHELGHVSYLLHAPSPVKQGGGANPDYHDKTDEKCIMTYDPACTYFCGMCLLRLMGWAKDEHDGETIAMSNEAASNKVEL